MDEIGKKSNHGKSYLGHILRRGIQVLGVRVIPRREIPAKRLDALAQTPGRRLGLELESWKPYGHRSREQDAHQRRAQIQDSGSQNRQENEEGSSTEGPASN